MELVWSGHLTGESDGTPSPAAGIIGACHRRLACCLTTGAGPPRHRYRPGTAPAAFTDNPASLAVSRKLGHRDDGMKRQVIRGPPAELRRLRLDRAAWARRDSGTGHGEVMIEGLDPCLPLFGLARAPRHLTP